MQDLEFTISQYLDGTLPPGDRIALERHLESDADARTTLDEYRRLNVAMKAMPLPVFRWDALSRSISAAVDAAHEEHSSQSYRMPAWIRMAVMPLALAASLLIVAGVGIEIYNSSHHAPAGWPNSQIGKTIAPTSSTFVAFQTDKASGPMEENISIGPSAAAVKNGPIMVSFGDDPAPNASHVTVVSGVSPRHDTEPVSNFDME